MSPLDQASELNVYPILARAVYNYIKAENVQKGDNEFIGARDQIQHIFQESAKVDHETKEQMQ